MPECPICRESLSNPEACEKCGWRDPARPKPLELTPSAPPYFKPKTPEEIERQRRINVEGLERCKRVLREAARRIPPGISDPPTMPRLLMLSARALAGIAQDPEAIREREAIQGEGSEKNNANPLRGRSRSA